MTDRSDRPIPYLLLVFVGFSIWGVLTTLFYFEAARIRGDNPHLGVWLVGGQLIWLYWAALVPIVVRLVRLLNMSRETWIRAVGAHLLVSFFFAALHMVYIYYIYPLPELVFATGDFTARWSQLPPKSHFFNFRLSMGVVYYLAIAGIVHAVEFYRQYSAKAVKAAQLESELKQAQLLALKMQLQPHFLFNALHSIVALIRGGQNDVAAKAAVGLGSILRHSLNEIEANEVTLKEELDFIAKFVEIERLRFGDRLAVSVSPDRDTLDAYVPSLILQPIVENAIKHGAAGVDGTTHVTICASSKDGELTLTVRNSSDAQHPTTDFGEPDGIGLSNVRQRLEHMYGDQCELVTNSDHRTGFEVRLVIPYTRMPLWS